MRKRVFSMHDMLAFGDMSGDRNPLHADRVAARRLLFGDVIVHGMHLILWVLDGWLLEQTTPVSLRSLAAEFSRPLYLDTEASWEVVSAGDGRVKIRVLANGLTIATLSWDWIVAAADQPRCPDFTPPQIKEIKVRSAAEVVGASGTIRLEMDVAAAAREFPNVAFRLSMLPIAQIASISRLVGMECPGLHSVDSKLKLTFERPESPDRSMSFSVARFEERFGLVFLDVATAGMRGNVKALLRPPPTAQPSCADLRGRVEGGEFRGQRALIIGGSRGLGELAAKLLALGGAEVKLTFQRGGQEAEAVARDIAASGGAAAAFAYDVLQPQDGLAAVCADNRFPTHLYYFATPFIFGATQWPHGASDAAINRFCSYYVSGFVNTFNLVRTVSPVLTHVFYPSTAAIEEQSAALGEYVLAKIAGEAACELLARQFPAIMFHKPRLPRLATDQTATMIAVETADGVSVMLNCLREFQMRSQKEAAS
jgi:hypothetical protein